MRKETIKIASIFIFIFSTISLSAQFGVRVKYNNNSFSGFDDAKNVLFTNGNDDLFSSNIELGLDYWFRLKNQRVEFMPEVIYGLSTSNIFSNNATADHSYFGFNFNTNIYAFDFTGDCDCPTFSKQGPSLKKGFFFSLAPGIVYTFKDMTHPLIDFEYDGESKVNLRLSVGAGYDIGINDLITITPAFNYTLSPGHEFNGLSVIAEQPTLIENIESSMNQLQFSIRLGFRPDYVKKYGRR